MMTLNEAIIHCRENVRKEFRKGNFHCASEHEQLATWLIELQECKADNVAHEFTILQALKGRTDYEGLPVSEINWLQVLRREVEKAKAYDRLMSGGKKTLKELANILGRAVVVNANGDIESFAGEPRIDLHYGFWYLNEDDEDYEDDRFLIPTDIVDYSGDWKDSLTLPDETGGHNA